MTSSTESAVELLVNRARQDEGVAWLEALRAAVRLVRVTLDLPLKGERDEELDEHIACAKAVIGPAITPPATRRYPGRL